MRVIGRTHAKSSALLMEELLPESSNKNSIPVTNNYLGHAMEASNLFNKDISDTLGRVGMRESTKMSIFGKPIDHDQDYKFVLNFG